MQEGECWKCPGRPIQEVREGTLLVAHTEEDGEETMGGASTAGIVTAGSGIGIISRETG